MDGLQATPRGRNPGRTSSNPLGLLNNNTPWGISLLAPKCDKLRPLHRRNLPRTEAQRRQFSAPLFATRSMSPFTGPSKPLPRRLAVLVVLGALLGRRLSPSPLGLQLLPRLNSDPRT